MAGKIVEIKVAETDDTYMFVGFITGADELNQFGSQTVEGDNNEDDDDAVLGYGAAAIAVIGLFLLFFVIFF